MTTSQGADSRELATLPSSIVGLAVGPTAVLWLRARDRFLVPTVLGTALAGIDGVLHHS
ncbi:hypothetical protein [Streptomyces sp. 7N604]|uniref:hypothetical protein n=1 Tax=Streptomyces sp. 7N604 TaxID=3457415 RepID=UPI003FD3FD5A